MKKLIICFDIDNVICRTKNSNYKKSTPIKKKYKNNKLVKKQRSLHKTVYSKIHGKKQ